MRGVNHVLGHDGVLVKVLGLGHQRGPGQVDGVAQAVQEAVPGLGHAFVRHFRGDEISILVS